MHFFEARLSALSVIKGLSKVGGAATPRPYAKCDYLLGVAAGFGFGVVDVDFGVVVAGFGFAAGVAVGAGLMIVADVMTSSFGKFLSR